LIPEKVPYVRNGPRSVIKHSGLIGGESDRDLSDHHVYVLVIGGDLILQHALKAALLLKAFLSKISVLIHNPNVHALGLLRGLDQIHQEVMDKKGRV
jgi:hypothetical protein